MNKIIKYSKTQEVESLKYYNDINIIPSDESLFTFLKVDDTVKEAIVLVMNSVSGDVVIPYRCEIDNEEYVVTTVGSCAQCTNLNNLILPNTVTLINDEAFTECHNLQSITIPNSVMYIGYDLFTGCTLSDMNLKIVCTMGSYAYNYAKTVGLETIIAEQIKTPGEFTIDGGEIFNDYDSNVATGDYSHAEGYNTKSYGKYCHAEGNNTTAGKENDARRQAAHSEGRNTTASGMCSHAEGYATVASAGYAHAEGWTTTASGSYSHSEGYKTVASEANAHAEGEGTIAAGWDQHVEGSYNIIDSNSIYVHIVGNGTKEDVIDEETGEIITQNRSNAHTLDWEGNAWYAGKVTAEGDITDADGDYILINKKFLKEYINECLSSVITLDAGVENEGRVLKVVGGRATWVMPFEAEGVEV